MIITLTIEEVKKMENAPKSKQEIINNLISNAMKNDEFKQRLISDPKGALEEQLKVSLPANLKITTLEEKSDQLYLVLPINEEIPPSGELSDMQLDNVAGGGACWENCDCCPP